MEKRIQSVLSIALGALALALMAAVVFRYASTAGFGSIAIAPAELETVQRYALIDLNHADESELQALPGIGEVLAERIIAWREENGGFHSKEDVLAVQGIGEATYEKIAPYITY